jgi:PIN domain nuclease of toxin-antitoxin system
VDREANGSESSEPFADLPSHLANLETLPRFHRDPFDRMLVAQANAESLAILSDDAVVRKYAVAVS